MNGQGFTQSEVEAMSPKDFRNLVRQGKWTDKNLEVCRGYAMANLAVVPKDFAFEFFQFTHRNPRAFPVIDVTEPGDPHPKLMAPEADLQTDLPKYRVFQDGLLIDEPTDVIKYWRDDLVAFLVGCSLSFDWSLKAANIQFHRVSPIQVTSVKCVPAGHFSGPMVVGCRAFKDAHHLVRAIQVTSRHLSMHGPPVHIGDPAIIGVKDQRQSSAPPEEVIAFWATAAGLTEIAKAAKIPFMIVHCPGCMFVTDRLTEELAVL